MGFRDRAVSLHLSFKLKTPNKIRKACGDYIFSNLHYIDFPYDINFRLRFFFSDSNSEKVFFKRNFQQKYFDDFKTKNFIRQFNVL